MGEKLKTLGVTGGAVGLSSLALAFGLCCVSPWAVGLLGVGGAVLLARIAFIQPYIVAATLVLLVLSFWYAYRRRAGETTATNRKMLRWFVWGAALIVVAIDVLSFAPLFLP